jgi:hypothetical protein
MMQNHQGRVGKTVAESETEMQKPVCRQLGNITVPILFSWDSFLFPIGFLIISTLCSRGTKIYNLVIFQAGFG